MRSLILTLAGLIAASHAQAANVTMTRQVRLTTAAEIASDPALAGQVVTDFFMSTDTEVLSIDNVFLQIFSGGPYQHVAGSDAEPPLPADVATTPALGADAWISTPGATTIIGGGFGNSDAIWFDGENNGPQNNFNFARLTIPNDAFTPYKRFNFRVNVVSSSGQAVENISFSAGFGFHVPEPASAMLAGVGLLPLAARRRRS